MGPCMARAEEALCCGKVVVVGGREKCHCIVQVRGYVDFQQPRPQFGRTLLWDAPLLLPCGSSWVIRSGCVCLAFLFDVLSQMLAFCHEFDLLLIGFGSLACLASLCGPFTFCWMCHFCFLVVVFAWKTMEDLCGEFFVAASV